jgi:hypothetical protein
MMMRWVLPRLLVSLCFLAWLVAARVGDQGERERRWQESRDHSNHNHNGLRERVEQLERLVEQLLVLPHDDGPEELQGDQHQRRQLQSHGAGGLFSTPGVYLEADAVLMLDRAAMKVAAGDPSSTVLLNTSVEVEEHVMVGGVLYADTVGELSLGAGVSVGGVLLQSGLVNGVDVGGLASSDQALDTTDQVSFASLNTGFGNNELHKMNQHVRSSDDVTFDGLTLTGSLAVAGNVDGVDISALKTLADVNAASIAANAAMLDQPVLTTSNVVFDSVDTGHGANELHAMNQDVQSSDLVTFAGINVNGNIILSGTVDGVDVAATKLVVDQNEADVAAVTVTANSNAAMLDQPLLTTSNVVFNSVNTGHGANELHAMNQDVQSSDLVTFAGINVNGNIILSGTVDNVDIAALKVVVDSNTADASSAKTAADTNALRLDQAVKTTSHVTFSSLDTGLGAHELYAMDQNVRNSDLVQFAGLTVNGNIIVSGTVDGVDLSTVESDVAAVTAFLDQPVKTTSTVTFAKVNTGLGATECFPQNQALRKSDNVRFVDVRATGDIIVDGTVNGVDVIRLESELKGDHFVDWQRKSRVQFLNAENVNGNLKGFSSGFAVDDYAYFVPKAGSMMMRVPADDFSESAVETLDLEAEVSPGLKGYCGGVVHSDGRAYLSPFYASGAYHGKAVRFDYSAFSAATVEHFNMAATHAELVGFTGTLSHADYVYYVPYQNARLARVHKNAFMSAGLVHRDMGNTNYKGYAGGLILGDYAYFVPYAAGGTYHGLLTRMDLLDYEQNLVFAPEVVDLAGAFVGLVGFKGGFSHGGYVYLAPHATASGAFHGHVARIHHDSFSLANVTYFDASDVQPDLVGFAGGAFLNSYGYYFPYSNGVDAAKVMARVRLTGFGEWDEFDVEYVDLLGLEGTNAGGYDGGFAYNGFIYMVPDDLYSSGAAHGNIVRFRA